MSMICSGLKQNRSLLTLDVSHNCITNIKDLCEALEDSMLEELVLAGNRIGNEGCEDLGGIIDECLLISLDLSNNHISSEGLLPIWKGLCKNNTMSQLKLDFNNFASGLTPEFTVFMSTNISLKSLSLAGTELSDKGVVPFNEGFVFNHGLVTLNLSKNKISNNGVSAIVAGLGKNKYLRTLNLAQNKIKVTYK